MVDAISGAVVQATVGAPLSEALEAIKHALLGFNDDVVSLQSARTTIEAALLDADSMEEQSHTQRDTLEKLRCELHRLTAFLLVREAKAMRREAMGGSRRFMKEARLFFSPSNQLVARFLDARKVKDIRNKLDVIAKDYAQFGTICGIPTPNRTQVWRARETEFGVISARLHPFARVSLSPFRCYLNFEVMRSFVLTFGHVNIDKLKLELFFQKDMPKPLTLLFISCWWCCHC